MPKGSGAKSPRKQRQEAQQATSQGQEVSQEVLDWWAALRKVADAPEMSAEDVDQYVNAVRDWDVRLVQQALRCLDLSLVRGDLSQQQVRLVQAGLRMTQGAISSGALVARLPDVVGVAYVEADHIVDPVHSGDDLRERLLDPYGLSEVDTVRADY